MRRPSAGRRRWPATRCRAEGIRLNIYRPSVVCGDSRTGRSLLFNAVYYPVRTVLFLRDVFVKDIRERGGKRAAAMGVSLDSDGSVRLPIRIGVGEGEGVNIVPVDHFTAAFLALLEAADGGTFHIVNPRLKPVGELVAHAAEMFALRGIEARPAAELDGASRNPLESLFDGYLEAYGPYMRDRRIFGREASGPILAATGARSARSSTTASLPNAWPTPSRPAGAPGRSPGRAPT